MSSFPNPNFQILNPKQCPNPKPYYPFVIPAAEPESLKILKQVQDDNTNVWDLEHWTLGFV